MLCLAVEIRVYPNVLHIISPQNHKYLTFFNTCGTLIFARSIISEVLDLFVGIVEDSLIEFGEFTISNLFKLYVFKSKRNKGFNGFTGEHISYEPSYNLKVHASKQLRGKLNIAKENKSNNSAREE